MRDEERERRDIVSGEILPEHRLIRFVADPDGNQIDLSVGGFMGRG